MKLTLLEIVQDIMNDLDSDEVNSIDDTIESQQVAQIVKACYLEMMSNRNWPHLKKLLQLDALGDLNHPNYLKLPDNTKEMVTLLYDVSKATDGKIVIKEVKYKHPDEFLRFLANRNSANENVKVVTDFGGSKLLIYKNKHPEYWTSFDDKYIVFDSYDVDTDDTMQTSKSQAVAYIFPEWVHSDDAIPNLPIEAFSALVEEAKSTASMKIKQMADQKAEQKSARQQRWLARKAWSAHGGIRYPDYGRKGKR